MTKKHFIQLANVIINHPDIYFDKEFFMSDLIDMCKESNPNFDEDKFIKYIENGIDSDNEVDIKIVSEYLSHLDEEHTQ